MSALVRLYPRTWRDRYESEFLDVLESRPPSPRDRLDIVRGALDARLHQELPGSPESPRPTMQPARLAAACSIVAGAAWLAWLGLVLQEFRRRPARPRDPVGRRLDRRRGHRRVAWAAIAHDPADRRSLSGRSEGTVQPPAGPPGGPPPSPGSVIEAGSRRRSRSSAGIPRSRASSRIVRPDASAAFASLAASS